MEALSDDMLMGNGERNGPLFHYCKLNKSYACYFHDFIKYN